MTLTFTLYDPQRVIDHSEAIANINNNSKQAALALLKHFDIIQDKTYTLSKHYVFDTDCENGTLPDWLEKVSELAWSNFVTLVKSALGDTKFEGEKVGKIYVGTPKRFSWVGVDINNLQPYAFTFYNAKEDHLELMTEMNFGIEIY